MKDWVMLGLAQTACQVLYCNTTEHIISLCFIQGIPRLLNKMLPILLYSSLISSSEESYYLLRI
jgi:hypothetical protein